MVQPIVQVAVQVEVPVIQGQRLQQNRLLLIIEDLAEAVVQGHPDQEAILLQEVIHHLLREVADLIRLAEVAVVEVHIVLQEAVALAVEVLVAVVVDQEVAAEGDVKSRTPYWGVNFIKCFRRGVLNFGYRITS